ncbi:DUF6445 family protein [Novosphingobium sp. BK486]|uniref:DUF6445 family protein n=1 Tax=unclassified Novosphingobium TaxID=2644732 RepID=UPI001808FE77|nr:hypothetical protein [Novosphingobium sp. BK256]MBB3373893.1 hypothetical protein [Novosphingobium sp. BK280]MBB3378305.1 hypothetical protein [Novosphingobium sp. BK258]MBB3419911.1 hypothetical protein [Novosphingobium sp. BK267]MBB3447768.1 hypothetical protein [Novosphingobium sp. BK352]MBB3477175.1 hypothetical protein [Novosphingobium sp. BK369]MBB3500393.1 hypothetical protein [Novosphingobium sp. BK336]MBB3536265.1 hypothetical protein [Novosphingobium sp. BK486]MBB3555574.1 hypo
MPVQPPIRMGREAVPLWIIDDAHPAPQALHAAAAAASLAATTDDLYPGVRAPAPAAWTDWLNRAVQAWPGLEQARALRADFAIATRDPAALAPVQRIPHFDDADETIMAVVHYLCHPPHGGTSFHRHRATGFERVTKARAPAWRQALAADAARHGLPPAAYHTNDTAMFERIGAAALRHNRLIVYPANCLHCGDVAGSWAGGDRLTITALLRIDPV